MHLEPLGSLLGGHWRCWRAQSAFYEKVLLARAGCMKMVVLEGCWRLLGRCLVVLGGSWRLLGRSGVALGSCWLDQPVSLAICRVLVWQPANVPRGGKLVWPPPPSRLSTIEKQGLQDQQDQQGQTWAARVARRPAGTTWAARVARDSFQNGSARQVAPQGPADTHKYK